MSEGEGEGIGLGRDEMCERGKGPAARGKEAKGASDAGALGFGGRSWAGGWSRARWEAVGPIGRLEVGRLGLREA